MNIKKIQDELQRFADERNWEQFHTPKNLVMALSAEAGELTELFQWLTEEESKHIDASEDTRQKIEDEIADIQVYLIRLAHKLGVDIERAVQNKMKKNAQKYPVHLAKGSAKKYTEFQ
jgi:NTP pyrophosphatase (non-canonical NTP hydrolase)